MDKTESRRALELRKRILKMGFPCAVSFPPYAVDHLRPVLCILTFLDAIDVVRRSPLEDIPALVLGEGFVNSLFHARTFAAEEQMLARMEDMIFEHFHTEKRLYFGIPGYILPNGFVVNALQIYYRIFHLDLTEREKRILQVLLFAPEHCHSYRRIEAYSFPYPYHENTADVTGTISAQISNINRKAVQNAGKRLIRYSAEGGYVLHIRKPAK
ncbi:MAG: hypothetical protein IJX14_09410 [Clostridia bacterium]|nr:hypothetical protein [Clostridia bacterium]